EVLIDKIGKKPAHLRRTRSNKLSGQATGEARAVNRSRISSVRKSLKGEKLSLKKS
ncbi:MAG TPA: ATP-dependent helicase, partial [Pseudoalteromonas sp.]|nr:ATP-dependent helicase [Pseudoalteromonas sp.]